MLENVSVSIPRDVYASVVVFFNWFLIQSLFVIGVSNKIFCRANVAIFIPSVLIIHTSFALLFNRVLFHLEYNTRDTVIIRFDVALECMDANVIKSTVRLRTIIYVTGDAWNIRSWELVWNSHQKELRDIMREESMRHVRETSPTFVPYDGRLLLSHPICPNGMIGIEFE